MARCTRYNIMW